MADGFVNLSYGTTLPEDVNLEEYEENTPSFVNPFLGLLAPVPQPHSYPFGGI